MNQPDLLDQWQATALGVIRQPEPPLSVEAGVHLANYLLDACLALRAASKRTAELEAAFDTLYSCNVWVGGLDDGDKARLRRAKKARWR